jgi:hypothetical protein
VVFRNWVLYLRYQCVLMIMIFYKKKMDERMWKKPSKCEEGSKILESLLYLQRSALRYDHVVHHPMILSNTHNEIK